VRRSDGKEKVCRIISAARLFIRSERDIQAYIRSDKVKEDAARLNEHLHKHGGEPSPEDLKQMPALTEEELSRTYRPLKTRVTVRLDGDVLAWLKSKGERYQTQMNAMLHEQMLSEKRRSSKGTQPSS
jgi:uncharacterized protein (DUF4415 family)